ncbi:MAG: S8 family serine peptidase [Saprospiraceae bacterium]|nr:S8 family serine peptidase [Saprospiraceae bacterium]
MPRLISTLFLILFATGFAFSQNNLTLKTYPPLLEKLENGGQHEMIIMLSEQADLSGAYRLSTKAEKGRYVWNQLNKTADATQGEVLAVLEQAGVYYHAYKVVNCIYTVADFDVAATLANLPSVSNIYENTYSPLDGPVDMDVVGQRDTNVLNWGLDMIQAPLVWKAGFTGEGVTVAGQDTGYDWDHIILKPKYRGYRGTDAPDHNYNWHDGIHEISPLAGDSLNPCGLSINEPCDDNNHGTHTMGTMVGSNGDDYYGVAPDARWIGCRNMERGNGSPASYMECFEWFLAPTDLNDENPNPDMSPHVINNSWYCSISEGCDPANSGFMETVVDNLKAAGVVVVVSAGNFGSSGCETVSRPPAIFTNSFSIGATASNDTIARFSSRGPVTIDGSNRLKPDVSAPGVSILSSTIGDGFASFSGTSMAGPHVAGAVALIISANPAIAGDVEAIETILKETADPKTDTTTCGGLSSQNVPNHLYGYGRINVYNAVLAALNYTSAIEVKDENLPVNVFPNPFTSQLTFDVRTMEGKATIQLFDLNGKVIYKENFYPQQERFLTIAVPASLAGLLTYKIVAENGWSGGKVIRID